MWCIYPTVNQTEHNLLDMLDMLLGVWCGDVAETGTLTHLCNNQSTRANRQLLRCI